MREDKRCILAEKRCSNIQTESSTMKIISTSIFLCFSGLGSENALINLNEFLFKSKIKNKAFLKPLLRIIPVIRNVDIWRKSVSEGTIHANIVMKRNKALGRDIVYVERTKLLRFFCHFKLTEWTLDDYFYSFSFYLKTDKNFDWPHSRDQLSRWAVVECVKIVPSRAHIIEVDRNWWRRIHKGTEDFSQKHIRVVREMCGWVRVDLFYDNPLLIQTSDVAIKFEDKHSLWKGGISLDFWQVIRHHR